MVLPQVRLEVPSYEQAKAISVELRVEGEDGAALLAALGVAPEDIVVTEPVNGPRVFTGKVYPFALMFEEAYADWLVELMRQKLQRHWWERW